MRPEYDSHTDVVFLVDIAQLLSTILSADRSRLVVIENLKK